MDWIKKIICLTLLLVPCRLCAENAYTCVVLETKEGEMMEFSLSSNPYLIQKADTIIMSNDEKKVEVIMKDIMKIYFSSSTNGIKKAIESVKGKIVLQQDCVCLSNFNPGEQIGMYNLSGQQILKRVITSQGTLIISFLDIPKGVSIIKSSRQSFKINRK